MCFNSDKADKVIGTVVGLALIAYGIMSQNYIIQSIQY